MPSLPSAGDWEQHFSKPGPKGGVDAITAGIIEHWPDIKDLTAYCRALDCHNRAPEKVRDYSLAAVLAVTDRDDLLAQLVGAKKRKGEGTWINEIVGGRKPPTA